MNFMWCACRASLVLMAMLSISQAVATPGGLGGADGPAESEDYLPVPMPPGFRVEATEREGPVFADAQGRTLYRWPLFELRNGYTGDPRGTSNCVNIRYTESAGLMSPYPAGLVLPDVETRPTCTEMWPPVFAMAQDTPVGSWTIITRKDGAKQWAYDGFPLYTSKLDSAPGDVLGGTAFNADIVDGPAIRVPVGPPPNIPPGFAVVTTVNGRLLMNEKHFSVYTFDKDVPGKPRCDTKCWEMWPPVLAAAFAQPKGEWSIIERAPGVRQWAFRGKLLYTHAGDRTLASVEGSDVAGWRNVYMRRAPEPPKGFTVQDAEIGQVLADQRGMTVYIYRCGDDALDQLACDHPDSTQVYRLAICGAGDASRCLESWPYVLATKNAKSSSRIWSTIEIDPMTGRKATGQPGALVVWAYRGRPVYTYAGDRRPGDTNGDSRGEYSSDRNGFQAFWLRDDIFNIVGR